MISRVLAHLLCRSLEVALALGVMGLAATLEAIL